MPESRRDYITFVSQAPGLDPETFLVASVEGTETIGRPFRFELELLSRSPDLDFQAILREAATLGIKQGVTSSEGKRGLVTVQRHGVLAAFEQVGSQNDWTTYRAVLVPPLWRLGLTHQSRIFQNLTVPEMVSRILQDAGIPSDRFRFLPASRPYAQREYAVQYEETDLDFVHRWLEHEGIFYWFRHEDDHVVAVFGDSQAHAEDLGETVSYVQAGTVSKEEAADSAFDWYDAGRIGSFSLRQVPIPRTVVLREYNWRTPLESLEVAREVSPDGIGLHYEYNNHYKSAAEGQELARIRAEEIRCRERVAEGRGTCRTFHAGACFVLADHYRPDFNASFLLTEVRHRATQDVALATNSVWRSTYGNEFTAIPNDPDRPFRPERSTPWPEIKGVMHARVDGTPGAASAEVDSWGRYKVKLPLDRSEAKEGESSRYVRMAQPNAGPDGGFHFPLKPGVEVVLSHMDGDPDRPIITGAVPNPETRSPVGTGNEMDSVIQTPGGKISLHGEAGHEQIQLQSGASTIRFGASSEPNYIYQSSTFGVEKNLWGKSFLSGFGQSVDSFFGTDTNVGLPQIRWLVQKSLDFLLDKVKEHSDQAADDKKKTDQAAQNKARYDGLNKGRELKGKLDRGEITQDQYKAKMKEDKGLSEEEYLTGKMWKDGELTDAEPVAADYTSVDPGLKAGLFFALLTKAILLKIMGDIVDACVDKATESAKKVIASEPNSPAPPDEPEDKKIGEKIYDYIEAAVLSVAPQFIPYADQIGPAYQMTKDLIKGWLPGDFKGRKGNPCFRVLRKEGRSLGYTSVSTKHDGENIEFITEVGDINLRTGSRPPKPPKPPKPPPPGVTIPPAPPLPPVGAAGDVNVHAGGHFKVQALGVATLAGGSEKNVPPPSAGAKRVPFAVLRINEPLAELLTKGAHIGIVDVDSPTAPSSNTRTVQLFVHTTDDPAISGLHLDKYGSTLTGNRIAVVGGGKEKESRLFLGQKGVTIFARGGANNDAGLNIALQVGKTKIVLDGKKIRMQSAGGKAVQVEIDGEGGVVNINSKGEINVKADTKITLHSAKVELNADVDIKGKLNGCDLTDQATAPVTVANSFNVNFAQAPSVVPAKTPAFPKEVFASETERKTYVQDTVRKHFVKIIDEVEKDLDMVKK